MADNVIVRVPEQQFIRGEDGYSPEVTIENIDHGHSVTITDRDHPTGQSFNVMDGDSAYEQAVAGGYTGTEEQFNEELSSFKELSDETKEAAPFYAEYFVTTKEEIEAAINYKRQIFLRPNQYSSYFAQFAGSFWYIESGISGTGYRFITTIGASQTVFELKNSWSFRTYNLNAPAERAEAAAATALTRMNSADASAQAAAGSAGDASTAATTATTKAGEATASATAADGSAKDAEAYAVGKRGGTDVGSTDPAYHNNAKYYAEQAAGSATAASGSATSAASSATAAGNAQTAAETAQGAAEDAQAAAEAVLASIPEDYTALSGDVDNLKSAVDGQLQYNAFNMIGLCPNKQSRTSAGITFTWIDEFTCSISGTSTGTASATIFNDKTSFPHGVKPGSRLRMSAEVNTTLYAGLRIAYYDSPDGSDKNIRTLVNMATGVVTDVVIPETATGLYIRVQLPTGKTVSDGIFKPCILVDRYTSEEVYDRILGSVFNLNSLIGSTLLTSEDDLFTLPVGLYHANSGTGAANSPTDAGYKLVIFVRANASQKTALLFATDGYAFTNACDSSNNWSSWKRLTVETSEQLDRLPNYYTDYMASRISDINKLENDISRNSDSFVFITDYHVQRNAGNSLKMIKEIVNETGITKLFFGGDAYQTVNSTDSRTDEQAMAYARKNVPAVYSSLQAAAPEFYSVLGNHEWNHLQASGNENLKNGYELNLAGVYNYCLRRHESSVSEIDENGNFYVDNTSQKIRYFFLQEDGEARPSNAALNWLGNQLMLVPNGYYVFLVCHGTWITQDVDLTSYSGRMFYLPKLINDMLYAYDKRTPFSMNFSFTANGVTRTYSGSWDYSSAPGNNVIAILGGHYHVDNSKGDSNGNILTIVTAGDLHKNGDGVIMTFVDGDGNTVSRTPGTIYEQAFDVCHIDIPNRKLYMTRFGGGVDREFDW